MTGHTGSEGEEKLVGIVVPCFNQGQYLRDCLGSLERQSMTAWRAVVIDDASTDGVTPALVEALRSPKVEVVHSLRNIGVCEVRNSGFRMLSSLPFHMTLDADDLIDANYLEMLHARLAAVARAAVAFGTLHAFGASAERPPGWKWPQKPFDASKRYDGPFVPEAGALFRTAAFRTTQGWRREFSSLSEGWDLALQLIEGGWTVTWVEDAVYYYRRHETAVSENWAAEKSVRLDALLMKYHSRGIAQQVGVRQFLSRRVTPAVRGALRSGDWREAWRLLAPAISGAPVGTTLALLESYYRRVVRAGADG